MSVDFVGQEPTMEFRVKRYADATFSDLGKEGLSPEEKRARLFELIEQYKDAEIGSSDSEEIQQEYVKEIEEYITNLIKKLS